MLVSDFPRIFASDLVLVSDFRKKVPELGVLVSRIFLILKKCVD